VRALQATVVLGTLWLASRQLAGHWGAFRHDTAAMRPRWSFVLGSAALVLTCYALLVHAWRTLVAAWGTPLPFWTAARVWSVGNLARFAPAPLVATTGAIGLLGKAAGVSPVAAAGSAVLGTLLNLGTGLVVLSIAGARLLPVVAPRIPPALLTAVGVAGLVALPLVVQPVARLAGRVLRRAIDVPRLPPRALWTAVTLNVAAWFLYGLAFRLLALAFFPGSGGGWVAYTAVFTFGYLIGWLFLPAPAGVGPREWALSLALATLGLLSPVQAAVVIVTSRLVLTLLEILPGVAFLAGGALSRSSSSTDVSL